MKFCGWVDRVLSRRCLDFGGNLESSVVLDHNSRYFTIGKYGVK